jgi:membrane-bound ClpP family serine protease
MIKYSAFEALMCYEQIVAETPAWRMYERLVASFEAEQAGMDASVTPNASLIGSISGVAALFTDPSRVPSDTFSKWVLLCAGVGLLFVVVFAIMGLSTYAKLLTVTAKVPRNDDEVTEYSKGVRNHARVVILALFVALIGTVTFAVNLLFTSSATPESAVTAAADFVAKQTNLTTDRIHFTGMAADNDAYVVRYSVPTIESDFTVRVAKKDGTVTQVTPQKKP